jgi:hypothetical protein
VKHAITLLALARIAHADPAPDPLAEDSAREANLESNAPREGMTFSAAVGGSLFLGSGLGKGGALSLRIGHVMTPSAILTFELVGGSYFHKVAMNADALRNDEANILAGAQYYTNPSLWIRGAAGYGGYTVREPMSTKTFSGISGAVGIGLDIARRRYLVLGIEAFGIASINRNGLLAMSGLCLGLSYY